VNQPSQIKLNEIEALILDAMQESYINFVSIIIYASNTYYNVTNTLTDFSYFLNFLEYLNYLKFQACSLLSITLKCPVTLSILN